MLIPSLASGDGVYQCMIAYDDDDDFSGDG